jgi:hypothetical protein
MLRITSQDIARSRSRAQGAAGSNPVAPTTFRVPRLRRGSTYSALAEPAKVASRSRQTSVGHAPTVKHFLLPDQPAHSTNFPYTATKRRTYTEFERRG